jgi:hypothetical protein
MDDEPTLGDLLAALHAGFTAIEQKMATKDELDELRAEMATKDGAATIDARLQTVEAHVKAIKADVSKIRDTFALRLEYDDRLRAIEEKLGIPGPR